MAGMQWLREYVNGTSMRIWEIACPASLRGVEFAQAVEAIYRQNEVVLMGVQLTVVQGHQDEDQDQDQDQDQMSTSSSTGTTTTSASSSASSSSSSSSSSYSETECILLNPSRYRLTGRERLVLVLPSKEQAEEVATENFEVRFIDQRGTELTLTLRP